MKVLEASRFIAAVINSRKISKESAARLEEIYFPPGYAEMGYDDPKSGIIAVGNWNNADQKNPHYCPALGFSESNQLLAKADNYVERAAKVLERRYKANLEWLDEWASCTQCGKIFRTLADHYGWMPSYAEFDEEFICRFCAAGQASEVLINCEGKSRKALSKNLGIDPTLYDYIKILDNLNSGLHEHMAADPKVISRELRKLGVFRFLFMLENTSQFYISFSCWVHISELTKCSINKMKNIRTDAKVSPATLIRRALEDLHRSVLEAGDKPGDGHILVSQVQDDGTMKSKWVSPQDFTNKKALQ